LRTRAVLLAAAVSAALGAAAQSISIPDAFTRAEKGNCLACHALPASLARPGGDVGPPLAGTRMRELGAARLNDLLDDPMRANANTTMPPYGRHRILDATELAAIVRFLGSLPDGEPGYAEPAATIDEAAMRDAIERGRALWIRKFKDKRSLSGCFPNGGRRAAAVHPQYDARVKRVVTLEMAVNQCLKVHHEKLLDPLEPDMAAIVAYARSLGHGQKLNLRVPAAAQSRFDEGKRLYFTRMGQRNFACASCHTQAAGKRYGAVALPAARGLVARTSLASDGKPLTLQARMRQCLERMGAAPFPAGSDELNHLEYYLAQQSNGMPLAAPR
jgi:sulfur oxidation c-type cytochrome SoxA/sulfur oxidation c-type cytochrome SoxX